IWKEARLLVPELQPEDLVRSYAGNRAQMVDRKGQLVEDMVVRETPRAVHVLNAVSPGLTCSLPFGEHLAALAAKKLDPRPGAVRYARIHMPTVERVPPMGPIASARFLDSPRSRPLDAGAPMHDAPDVLVIGGGPAGSIAATLLA